MDKNSQNLVVFISAVAITIALWVLFGLYTVIVFPILLFLVLFAFRKKNK